MFFHLLLGPAATFTEHPLGWQPFGNHALRIWGRRRLTNIISGVVKLTKTLTDGREQIVGLQFASDLLGRPYRSTSSYNIEAVTEVRLCAYERRQFERLLREFPGLQGRLFEHTLDALDAAREWMLLLGRKSAEERVASFLLMVARRINAAGFDGQTARFDCPITQDEIADFLGLRIETVSGQLSRFRAQNIIAVEGMRTIIVLDKYRLEQASDVTPSPYCRA